MTGTELAVCILSGLLGVAVGVYIGILYALRPIDAMFGVGKASEPKKPEKHVDPFADLYPPDEDVDQLVSSWSLKDGVVMDVDVDSTDKPSQATA